MVLFFFRSCFCSFSVVQCAGAPCACARSPRSWWDPGASTWWAARPRARGWRPGSSRLRSSRGSGQARAGWSSASGSDDGQTSAACQPLASLSSRDLCPLSQAGSVPTQPESQTWVSTSGTSCKLLWPDCPGHSSYWGTWGAASGLTSLTLTCGGRPGSRCSRWKG